MKVVCSIDNVVASVSLLGKRKTEYMKVVCSIHASMYLCCRSSDWIYEVMRSIHNVVVVYLGSLFTYRRSICGFCKGDEWLYSRNTMSDRWWSMMTTAGQRNKHARDNLGLNISAEDVIVWIDFLIKSLHSCITPFLRSKYWRFLWSMWDRKISWKLSNRFMNPYRFS